jgi:hypothetical protein
MFGAANYVTRKAKELNSKGKLSTPNPKPGQVHVHEFDDGDDDDDGITRCVPGKQILHL